MAGEPIADERSALSRGLSAIGLPFGESFEESDGHMAPAFKLLRNFQVGPVSLSGISFMVV